jgi:hypothetical protein
MMHGTAARLTGAGGVAGLTARRLVRAAARAGHALICALVLGTLASAAPATAADPPPLVELNITAGSLPAAQRLLRVTKGDPVRLRISSDAPGELHLHAYSLAAKVAPGAPAQLEFQAYATGRFRLEWHASADNKAATGAHHAPPLATLEVRPR